MNKKKISWSDITYRQFKDLNKALEIEDETEKSIAVMQAIFGEDVVNLPLNEFNALSHKLDFLKSEIPTSIKVKDVKVNGREYYFDGMLGEITTAQYIDYQNYCKNNDEAKQFAVFFIPKGHKYNDGYDMLEVFEDIQDIPITVLMSAGFFFKRSLEIFIKIFQRSLEKQLKKAKIPKEMRKSLIKSTDLLNSLGLSLMYSNSVK